MVLSKLKKIRDELEESAKAYDEAFKNTALIAAESLMDQQQKINAKSRELNHKLLSQGLDKEYFLDKYGSLKNAKEEYKKIYPKTKYGKSWKDFLEAVQNLPPIENCSLTLEQRITRIEYILRAMGHDL